MNVQISRRTPLRVPRCPARPGAYRHRRPCRSRQVDPDRPLAARNGRPSGRQARRAQGRERPPRHAVRMVVPARCPADRARSGHHHRHQPDPAAHPGARYRPDRRAGTCRVSPQHDHRGGASRCRRADRRCDRGRARPDPSPRLSPAPARRAAGDGRHQQDGSRGLRCRQVQGDRIRNRCSPGGLGPDADRRHPDFRAQRRRRRAAHIVDRMVSGADGSRRARCFLAGTPAARPGDAHAGASHLQVRRSPHHCRTRGERPHSRG